MVAETGLTYEAVGYEGGWTFPATTGGGLPSQTLVNNAIIYKIERDIRRLANLSALTTAQAHKDAVLSYACDWVRKWIYENASGGGDATSVSVGGTSSSFSAPPKCPSRETVKLINDLRATPEITGVTD